MSAHSSPWLTQLSRGQCFTATPKCATSHAHGIKHQHTPILTAVCICRTGQPILLQRFLNLPVHLFRMTCRRTQAVATTQPLRASSKSPVLFGAPYSHLWLHLNRPITSAGVPDIERATAVHMTS